MEPLAFEGRTLPFVQKILDLASRWSTCGFTLEDFQSINRDTLALVPDTPTTGGLMLAIETVWGAQRCTFPVCDTDPRQLLAPPSLLHEHLHHGVNINTCNSILYALYRLIGLVRLAVHGDTLKTNRDGCAT